MKTTLLLLLTLTMPFLSLHAQELTNAVPRTDIEALEAQTNTVIVKGISLINSISMSSGTFSVRNKESTDITTGRKQFGIMLEFAVNSEERVRAVVDYSELPSFLDGIEYLSKITSDATDMASFDAIYTTKSGFRVIAFSSRRQGTVQFFVQFDGCVRVPLTSDQASQFRDLISSAKNSLDSLQAGK